MNISLKSAIKLTYNQLAAFSSLEKFWNLLDTVFGTQYNRTTAATLRSQLLAGDFSQLPKIKVISSSTLGNANGAYAASKNTIYLSNTFLATATPAAVSAVLLEEIGHFIDAHINQKDTPGDEGEYFSALVRGVSLSQAELQRLKKENDHSVIIIDGLAIAVEQANFIGTAANENITGTADNDYISAGAGNDTITAGGGNDGLYGDDGDDLLKGGTGDDNRSTYLGYINSDTRYGGLYGGAGNDTLLGEDGNDDLYGGSGNDSLDGGDGNDYLDLGGGNDTVIGGLGIDTLYLDNGGGTTNFTVIYTDANNFAVGVPIKEIEVINLISGSGNDTFNITAAIGNNTVQGGAGNDNVTTSIGNDYISAGAGNDTITAGAGSDALYGEDGDDLLKGGSGDDDNSIEVRYINFTRSYAGLYGGAGNDTLLGEDGNDYLEGGAGNDSLDGGDGNDELRPGDGLDTIIGGLGSDYAFIDRSTRTTNLNIIYTDIGNFGLGSDIPIKEVETVDIYSGSGNDTINISATTGTNDVQSGAGNDNVTTSIGNDVIYGEGGNDTITAGAGSDRVDGGDGDDLLKGGSGDDDNSIEVRYINFTRSYAGLYGGAGNDTLLGEDGNDYLEGGAGNDSLDGGDGNDELRPGDGLDTIIGGLGSDYAFIDRSTRTTNLNIIYTDIGNFGLGSDIPIKEVETVDIYSGSGNDTINISATTGTNDVQSGAGNDNVTTSIGNDVIYGEGGNDTITAGAGSDRVDGGDGDDLLKGGSGDDDNSIEVRYINFTRYYAGLYGGAGNDTLLGEDGNDYLEGGAGNDSLDGGDGNDELRPGDGLDTIIGGLGSDYAFIDRSTRTTNLNIIYTDIGNFGLGSDIPIKEVETVDIYSGSGNDTINISAANGDNRVQSGAGNDNITTSTGNDFLYGESGNDTIAASAGSDRVDGGDGDDLLKGGSGDDDNSIEVRYINFTRYYAGLYGGAGNDTLLGEDGDDYLEGGSGNDSLDGGSGNDEFRPGSGSDTIIGGSGYDTLYLDNGGGTTDFTVIYTDANAFGVGSYVPIKEIEVINLVSGSGNDTFNITAAIGNNTVEGGAGNDNVTTNIGNDYISAGIGNDTVTAGAGSDGLYGEDGDDLLKGGSGDDDNSIEVRYVNFTRSYAGLYGGAGNDTLLGEEGNDYLEGGSGNDSLDGGSGNDDLRPGSGSDTIIGGSGYDTLYLDNGAGTTDFTVIYTDANNFATGVVPFKEIEVINLSSGSGNDILNISAAIGNNTVQGGAGNDNVTTNIGNDYISAGIGNDTVTAGAGSDGLYGEDGDDLLKGGSGDDDNSIEVRYVNFTRSYAGLYGGAGNDTLLGEEGNDYLEGGSGNDSLDGGDGDDTLKPGAGADTIIGGAGSDYLELDHSDLSTALTLSYLDLNIFTTIADSTFKQVETIRLLSGNGNDTLNLSAAIGNNYVEGRDGNDTISGSIGNEEFRGGLGQDSLLGQGGNDKLYGEADNDILLGGAGNDSLYGDAGNDSLVGAEGNDSLYGGIGNDTLSGGEGDDYLKPEEGADTVTGGTGSDYLDLDHSDQSTALTLNYTDINTFTTIADTTFKEIETIRLLSGSGNDTLHLSAAIGNNYVEGRDGNDTISGSIGNEEFRGGLGQDSLLGQGGNDKLYGEAGNDTLSGGEGDDSLYGGAGNDSLLGGEGNDYFNPAEGSDTIIGGNGTDTLELDRSGNTITTNFTVTYTNANVFTVLDDVNFKDIESINFKSGSGNDILNFSATTSQDIIEGRGGNDNIITGSGKDRIYGGTGNDTISGQSENDLIFGGVGNDSLSGDSGSDGIYAGEGDDYLKGGTGDDRDTLLYTEYVFIDRNNNNLVEPDEIIPIYYFAGLWGEEGNDTLDPGLGADYVDGGTETDLLKVDYSTVTTGGISTTIGNNGSGIISAGDNTISYLSIEQFDILGTSQGDNLIGGNLSDTLRGGAGDDTLNGGGSGSNSSSGSGSSNSLSQADVLTGGLGRDRFILGNADTVFYDDNNSLTGGTDSYAEITDFNASEDIIQLGGVSSDYRLVVSGANTQLFRDKPGSEPDELIAVINSQTGLNLTNSYFNYVSNSTVPNITLALPPSSVSEDGTANLVYTFTRTGSTTNALTVNYGVAGTATFNTDYIQSGAASFTATTGTITFAAGASMATLTIDPSADITIESDETVALTLTSGTGYTIGSTTAVTGTITNDDSPSSITLALSPSSVTEDGTANLVYTFTRTGSTTNALTVNYGVAGTATFNTDYIQSGAASFTATTGTITFAAGASTATLTIDPTADITIESDETVALTLTSGTGYTVGSTAAVTGTITNDDSQPTFNLSINDVSVTEGNTGTTNATFTVSLSAASTSTVTVNYATANDTATAGSDYTATTGTLTFNPGQLSKTLTVAVADDTTLEPNETFFVNLSSATNATISDNQALGTIVNDETSTLPTLSINDITVVEGQNLQAVLTVTLSSASTQPVTVKYITTAVTATATSDYTTSSGTLTFAANTTTATITVPIINNSVSEPDETFRVTLSSPTNAVLQKPVGIVTITDTVQSNITTTLPTGVENLTLIGNDNINGTGNSGNNILTGNNGNNILRGNAGNNILVGGNGDDTYAFNASTLLGSDTIQESTTGGNDTISFSGTTSGVKINLGLISTQTINSNLKLTLSANNVIENVIGGSGSDRLIGNSLNNTLSGGSGNDVLTGGSGSDSDRFLYSSTRVFVGSDFGIDNLTDFNPGSDKLVLSKNTFAALASIVGNGLSQASEFTTVEDDGLAATSSAYLVYSIGSGSLYYNQNGSAAGLGTGAEFANLLNLPTLTAADFAIVV